MNRKMDLQPFFPYQKFPPLCVYVHKKKQNIFGGMKMEDSGFELEWSLGENIWICYFMTQIIFRSKVSIHVRLIIWACLVKDWTECIFEKAYDELNGDWSQLM